MTLNGSYRISAPRQAVWAALMDPEVLKKCLPGCEKLDPVGPDAYRAHMKVGIAAIKGSYQGSVSIHEKVAPEKFRMVVEGKGAPGFLRGEGSFELVEEGSETLLRYQGTAQVGGMIAGVGQRLVQGAARMVVRKFFEALSSHLASATP
ncbi:MAG: carbon monoxide dehydrogenase subunit G [Acidobacteria bacterium]|nr:carbon monoxide dehydrogenase subunit G [Acidobacteriota bacterium]